LGDYFTKHHSPQHHQSIRDTYLHPTQQSHLHSPQAPSVLRGCVDPSPESSRDPSHEPTNSTPKQNATAGNNQRIAKSAIARAVSVIGKVALRLIN
jgi:hypothetical protein